MRSRYYIITAYSEIEGRRVMISETDWGIIALKDWWLFKFNLDYKYMIMTIS